MNGVGENGKSTYGYNYGYGYGYGYTGSNKYYEAKSEEFQRDGNGNSTRGKSNGNASRITTNGKNGESNGKSKRKSRKSRKSNGKSNGSYAEPSNGNGLSLDEFDSTVHVADALRMDDN